MINSIRTPKDVYLLGSQGIKFEGVIPEITGSIPFNLHGLVEGTIDYYYKHLPKPETIKARCAIKQNIEEFHTRSGTLTSQVHEALSNLDKPNALLIRTGHQPNLLPYLNVFLQPVLLELLRRELAKKVDVPIVAIFIVIDTDIVGEEWFRRAYIPAAQCRNGYLSLVLPNYRKENYRVIHKGSVLDSDVIDKYFYSFRSITFQSLAYLQKNHLKLDRHLLERNIDELECVFEDSHRSTFSAGDGNARFISKIINNIWGYPTIFITNSQLSPLLLQEQEELISSRIQIYNQSINHARNFLISKSIQLRNYSKNYPQNKYPYWYLCDNCESRIPVLLCDNLEFVQGTCPACKIPTQRGISDIKHDRLIARIILYLLSVSSLLGVCCQIGYIGGSEYTLIARQVALRFGVEMPPMYLWRPSWVYVGLNQLRAITELRNFGLDSYWHESPELKPDLKDILFRTAQAALISHQGKASILDFSLNYGLTSSGKILENTLSLATNLMSEHIIEDNSHNISQKQFHLSLTLLRDLQNLAEAHEHKNKVENRIDEEEQVD